MGGSVSRLLDKIFGSKEMRLLMLGLDAAGKTSMYSCRTPFHSRSCAAAVYLPLLTDPCFAQPSYTS
jgi:hypothetical protein